MSIFNETKVDELTDEWIKQYGEVGYEHPPLVRYWDDLVRRVKINETDYWDWSDLYYVDLNKASKLINEEIRKKRKTSNVLNNISTLDLQNIRFLYKKYLFEQTEIKLIYQNRDYIGIDWADDERINIIMRYMINLKYCYKYINKIPDIRNECVC